MVANISIPGGSVSYVSIYIVVIKMNGKNFLVS